MVWLFPAYWSNVLSELQVNVKGKGEQISNGEVLVHWGGGEWWRFVFLKAWDNLCWKGQSPTSCSKQGWVWHHTRWLRPLSSQGISCWDKQWILVLIHWFLQVLLYLINHLYLNPQIFTFYLSHSPLDQVPHLHQVVCNSLPLSCQLYWPLSWTWPTNSTLPVICPTTPPAYRWHLSSSLPCMCLMRGFVCPSQHSRCVNFATSSEQFQ